MSDQDLSPRGDPPNLPVGALDWKSAWYALDHDSKARIAALEAEVARLREALEQTKAKADTKARAARRWRAKAEGTEAKP